MTQEMLIMVAILVGVIILSFIGILSRYRKCKSDERSEEHTSELQSR